MFTWPSRGSVWAYGYDRESTNYSRDSLEDLLRFLAKDPSIGEVAILAHSMGNWVALEALRTKRRSASATLAYITATTCAVYVHGYGLFLVGVLAVWIACGWVPRMTGSLA